MLALLLMPLVLVVSADDNLKATNVSLATHNDFLQYQLQFSADLLQTVSKLKSSQNVFFSPSSVHSALLLTYFSSSGNTDEVLKKLLRIPSDKPKGEIVGDYLSSKSAQHGTKYELSSVNRMYVDKKLEVRECMQKLFPQELQQADFADDPAGAVKQINSWVAEQTKKMITDVLPERSVTADTKLVIVNGAYFKGKWLSGFNKKDTHKAKFNLANGSTVDVTMMTQHANVSRMYDRELRAEILELPYEGDDISMFILLPDTPSKSAIPDLVGKLTGQTLLQVFEHKNATMEIDFEFNIPKFTVELELNLTQIFSSMGAESLFKGPTDLSQLFVKKADMAISTAVHKAKLQVDEEGSVAGASTAIEVAFGEPFQADHPFIYAIYDKSTKVLLFTGIFESP